jgi:hypothetical protein
MVARHRMPGTCCPEARPVGYGMIGWREVAIVSDGGQSVGRQITPYPTGRVPPGCLPGIACLATPHFVPPGQTPAPRTFFICVDPRSSAVALFQRFGMFRTRQNLSPE